jgi:hypothetical protein
MNLDLREVLVCLITIAAIAAATLVAVGAAATYSYVVHGLPPQQAAYRMQQVASTIDPCDDTLAKGPPTSTADAGLQCPVYRASNG